MPHEPNVLFVDPHAKGVGRLPLEDLQCLTDRRSRAFGKTNEPAERPLGTSFHSGNIYPRDPFIQKYGGAFPVNSLPEGLQALLLCQDAAI